MLENNQLKSKKKIIINVNLKNKPQEPKPESPKLNDELEKLTEISYRCKDYFIKFLQEKSQEINYTELMFNELTSFLNDTFQNLYDLIEAKRKQIQTNIHLKRDEFLSIKDEQLNHLNDLILKIEAEEKQLDDTQEHKQITQFATLLNEFYEKIEEIEKVNYKQNIKQSIQFLHNIIEDESAAFSQDKIFEPSIPNVNISFNNEQLFSVKDDPWEEFKFLTEKRQDNLESKINLYQVQIKV